MDLSKFSDTRILVVGDVMLDRYWWGSVDRISPEAPVPVVRLESETLKPGGAANVAVNAAALGSAVSLIGVTGEDASAAQLNSALASHNISSPGLLTDPGRSTIVKTRIIAHGQQVVRLDNEETRGLGSASEARLLEIASELIAAHDVLIISDYGKGLLTESVVRTLIEMARAANVPVLADPKGKHFEKYSGAFVLTPNRREAAEACKLEESLPDLVEKAGIQLQRNLDLENVLITESENGMTLFPRDGQPVHLDASAREVYDVTGAGDTVIACLAVALAAGVPIGSAAAISNVAAGLAIQQIGTTSIKVAELEKELLARPIDLGGARS